MTLQPEGLCIGTTVPIQKLHCPDGNVIFKRAPMQPSGLRSEREAAWELILCIKKAYGGEQLYN